MLIRSRNAITPIAREQIYLRDCLQRYFPADIICSEMRTFFRPRAKFTLDFMYFEVKNDMPFDISGRGEIKWTS